MAYFIAVGMIICISFICMFFSKKEFANVCIMAAGGIIVVLYGFGVAGKIHLGIYFLYGIAVIGLIMGIYGIISKKIKYNLLGFEFIIFLFGSILIYFITMNMKVSAGDEFTHWGSVVKNMAVTDKLSYSADNWLFFPEYLPGTAVFEYFFCTVLGTKFHEATIYGAMDILILAGYLPVFSFCYNKKKTFENIIITLVLLILPLLFMPKTWLILQVDSLLIILFANILLAFRYMQEDRFKCIYLSALFILLALVKESGIAFGCFILIYMFIFKLVSRRGKIKTLSLYIFSMLIPFCSWKIMIKLYDAAGTQKQAQSGISIGNIWKWIIGAGTEEQYEITKRFLGKFLDSTMGSVCPIILFIILIFILPILIQIITQKRDIVKIECTTVLISFTVYTIYLLFMYLFMWESNIGLDVTSFWRYMGTFVGAWLFYMTSEVFICIKDVSLKLNRIILSLIISCMLIVIPIYDIEKSFIPIWGSVINTGNKLRAEYLDSEKIADILDWKKDRVYIVSQFAERSTLNYLDYWVTRYNIAPVKTNEFPDYSIGDTGNDKDTSHIELSPDEWEEVLIAPDSAYTYVYIYAVDEKFKKDYGRLFEKDIINRGLYSINITEGCVRLLEVE